MPIPDFQTLMVPLIRAFEDQQEHFVRDLIDELADHFDLSNEEREQLLPSGRQSLFRNRVAWAVTHITKAGLLERVGHGKYQITTRGLQALVDNPGRIDMNYLKQFPEYREFRSPRLPAATDQSGADQSDSLEATTPRENLESSYLEIRRTLAQDLLDSAKAVSPGKFETLVIDLLLAMGYGGSQSDAARAVGRSGDEGIDGIINEDKLGLDTVYIQAKRWEAVVGRPEVQNFAGSLEGQRAGKGVMLTTSRFTNSAHEYVKVIQKRIILIDGEQLAQLMIDHGIGVSEVQTYTIYRIDSDYFSEE